jgi:hypothetical protein
MNAPDLQEQEDGLESEISEDAFENDPVLVKYQTNGEQEYWSDELEAARKEQEKFNAAGVKIIRRFADERSDADANRSNFNIFFANTEIKQAAIYARTPVPDISRRFMDSDDQVSRVAANLLQRNLILELDKENFDAKFKQMAFDRLVPGIGIGWVRLEQEEHEHASVDPLTGETITGTTIANQDTPIDYVAWNDFLWAPCRVWTECRWVARRVAMSKDAIKDRFGDTADVQVLSNLAYSTKSGAASKDSLLPKHKTQATTDVYEIWDKERRLIFWVTDGADVPLDVQEDANEFPDFFPTPLPPLGRFTTSNTIPRSDFSLVQDQYNELDDLNNRCTKLVQALKLRFVYNAAAPELADLYTTTAEGQGVPVKDWTVFATERGGLRGSLEFAPLDETAATYAKLIQARDQIKQQIYEVEGISDILRGAATPYETATATNAKGAASSSRLSVMQHEVADYIARLLRLKAHLICKFYQPEIIVSRAGTLNAADQPLIGQAIGILKNDQMSNFKLMVSVDSIQLPNWNQEKQERNEFIQALTNMLGQMLPAVERTPQLAPLALELIKFGISGFKGAQPIEAMVDQQLQVLVAQQSQPQQPPPPSPAALKAQATQAQIQADAQIAQLEESTKLQIAQMQAQLKGQENQIKVAQLQLNQQRFADDVAHRQAQTHIDAVDSAHSNAMDVVGLGGQ